MTIQVTGKNIDAGAAYKTYIEDKIATALGKYIGPEIAARVRLEKERSLFRTACSIRLKSGLLLEAHGEAGDAYASADAALEHLEKQVRRYKRRAKSHHGGRTGSVGGNGIGGDETARGVEDDELDRGTAHPVVIAETEQELKELAVADAVLQLDLTESAFLLFRNASHGGLNAVYRRPDGHIGWIDPKSGANAGKVARAKSARDRR
jgi:ribosomal subunit interface protein